MLALKHFRITYVHQKRLMSNVRFDGKSRHKAKVCYWAEADMRLVNPLNQIGARYD